jgi:hypothetical protein
MMAVVLVLVRSCGSDAWRYGVEIDGLEAGVTTVSGVPLIIFTGGVETK